jgi:hypothetical protein
MKTFRKETISMHFQWKIYISTLDFRTEEHVELFENFCSEKGEHIL